MDETHRVLIVDDDEPVRDSLSRQLSRLGYSCTTAENGRAALAATQRGDFHVALIDLVMPEMDGITLLSEISKSNTGIVPVVLTALGKVSNAVSAMKLGAFDFLEKPVEIEHLTSVIERAVRHGELLRRADKMSRAAQQWQATFDAVPDLIAIVDEQYRFVRVNRAMAERLGCTPEEAVGMSCYGWMCDGADDPACTLETEFPAKDKKRIAEAYAKRFGGFFLVTATPLHDSEGRPIGCVHVARDVTEQRQTEDEIRKAHSETEKLLSSMSSILVEVDADLRVSRWNSAAELVFSIPAATVIGERFTDSGIAWDWEVISPQIQGWLDAHKPIRLPEMHYRRADGRDGILGVTVNPIARKDASPVGFFLLGADITERKNMELQLVQAQKLESIGQLAAGIAHEINTPTQYVGDNIRFLQDSFAELFKLQAMYATLLDAAEKRVVEEGLVADIRAAAQDMDVEYLSQEIPKAIQQSLDGVERVANIVRAMKEFSHPGSGEKTSIDLNHAIESTITVAKNEWKYVADVVSEFDPQLPPVSCLPGEFNQVILNILVNAAHAIAVVVGDAAGQKGTIRVMTRRDGAWAEVRISDTGPGIPEAIQNRVFDPFFTTKKVGKGTGQGLAIAHNVIVEKHGGSITFESEVGKGTTFIIRLPIEIVPE